MLEVFAGTGFRGFRNFEIRGINFAVDRNEFIDRNAGTQKWFSLSNLSLLTLK